MGFNRGQHAPPDQVVGRRVDLSDAVHQGRKTLNPKPYFPFQLSLSRSVPETFT